MSPWRNREKDAILRACACNRKRRASERRPTPRQGGGNEPTKFRRPLCLSLRSRNRAQPSRPRRGDGRCRSLRCWPATSTAGEPRCCAVWRGIGRGDEPASSGSPLRRAAPRRPQVRRAPGFRRCVTLRRGRGFAHRWCPQASRSSGRPPAPSTSPTSTYPPLGSTEPWATVFDREPSAVKLEAGVGVVDPLLAAPDRGGCWPRWSSTARGARPISTPCLMPPWFTSRGAHSTIRQVDKPSRHSLAPSRLKRVLEHVTRPLEAPLTLSDLAAVAGLQPLPLQPGLPQRRGRNAPGLRCQKAGGAGPGAAAFPPELPLAEVARQAGFTSPGYFSTAFKRSTGLKPSLYRQQL